ncbi:2-oxoacid:acceptor oxidoreductase subunit alpha [Patescibacteria group bacterium]
MQILKNLAQEEYSDKGEEIVKANLKAIELAFEYAKENFKDHVKSIVQLEDTMGSVIPKMVVNGNEAAALAAISAGVQFAAIYPMSPISNILHVLAKHQEEFGYVYKQPEDEIAAINMGLGAAFAGARSMTATSGGGFCLMTEAYGLAGITETPLVIVEGMRGGPGTGLPTWSAQGDLRFVLHAHQDDFPRIVLTPGDAAETFHLTMEAFNLAEKYQTPVVVLINKDICECDQSVLFFDVSKFEVNRGKFTKDFSENFERYKLEEDGISVRTFPGTGNFFIANSDEHDGKGLSSEEIENRNQQMQKRMRKLETCALEDMPKPQLFGPEDAELTLVSWGSNKGPILQALQEFDNVNFLHLNWISPFPTEEVKRVLENAKHVVNVEANYTLQMRGIIKEQTGFDIKDNFNKYDGRPFYFEEIREKINSVLKG